MWLPAEKIDLTEQVKGLIDCMPVKTSKIDLNLEESLYDTVQELANRDHVSISTKVHDLVKEALETREDIALSTIAEKREATFHADTALSHDEVW